MLLVSLVLSGVANYGDRLVLLPLMGGAATAIYYIASLSGKLLVMVVSPMSTVLLSYVSRTGENDKLRTGKLLAVSSTIGIVFWGVSCLLAPFILGLLYPNDAREALEYVPVVTVVSVLQAECSILNPTMMRFYSAKWQIIANALSLAVLLILGPWFSSMLGLNGFCLACLVAALAKFTTICVLIFFGRPDAEYATLQPDEPIDVHDV